MPSPRHPAVIGLIVAATGLWTWPIESITPVTGIDPSWRAALHLAAVSDRQAAPDILFTYGPLGFLTVPELYFTPTAALAFAFIGATHAAAVLMLVRVALRQRAVWFAALLIAAVILILPAMSPARVLVVLVLIWSLQLVLADSPPRRILPFAVCVGALAGVAALIKFNDAVAIGLIGLMVTTWAAPIAGWRPLAAFVGSGLVVLGASWSALGYAPIHIPAFIFGSLEIATGYSTAMGWEQTNREWEYGAAAACVIALGGLAITSTAARERRTRIATWALIALLVLLGFKHGFTRHDGHSIGFFALLLVAAMPLVRRPGRSEIVMLAAGMLSLVWASGAPLAHHFNPLPRAEAFVDQLSTLASEERRGQRIRDAQLAMRSAYALDPTVIELLERGSVHVGPHETGVVWAYYPRFEWRPLPVFQAYSAYTRELDLTNARVLASDEGPQWLLWEATTPLDSRHPNFESPEAMLAMVCHYREVLVDDRWQVLERVENRCGAPRELGETTVEVGTWVDVPAGRPGELVYARIDGVRAGIAEAARALVYKSERVTITQRGKGSWPLVPETAAGPLILQAPPSVGYHAPFAFPQRQEAIRVQYPGTHPSDEAAITVAFQAVTVGSAPSTDVVAHRGDTAAAPENSLAAVRASRAWADAVEIDLWLASDGTFRLTHARPPERYESLPTLDQAFAEAGETPLELDLKDDRLIAHERLAEWIEARDIAASTTVNVKSIEGARAVDAVVPDVTIEAQPEWVPTAAVAPEVELVLVWGEDWRDILGQRPVSEVALFVNDIHEPGVTRWTEALDAGVARYLSDGPP